MDWNEKKDLISPSATEAVKARNSFDVLRYFFAFSLILVHFCTLTDTPQFWFITGGTRVKAFFIITGFLVLYSILRSRTLKDYFLKRIRRILPAYVACITLCLIIGLCLTDLSWKEFLTNGTTWKYYLSNILFLNFLQPELPGVFQDHAMTAMDGSLWSMKVELCFYVVLPLLVWLLCKFRKGIVIACIFALSVAQTLFFNHLYEKTGVELYHTIQHQFGGQLVFFVGGMSLLLWFDALNRHLRWLFPVCLLLFLISEHWQPLVYAEPLTFAVVIIGIAYHCPRLNFLFGVDNISYGLYLYHFPVIQVLISLGLAQYNIYLCFITALFITFVVALLSWKFIEKPMLRKPYPGKPGRVPSSPRPD